MSQDEKSTASDAAGRKRRVESVSFTPDPPSTSAVPPAVPWTLQHYFDGEIDLVKELVGRFPQVPVLSLFNTREVGSKNQRGVATLSTQDGAGSLIVEVDVPSRAVQFTFVMNSMLALRFCPGKLTQMDRTQWLDPLRREAGEAAFLWDQSRWTHDYLIGAGQKNFMNIFAFSPNHSEAAVRLTPEVSHKLLEWLEVYWHVDEGKEATGDPLPKAWG